MRNLPLAIIHVLRQFESVFSERTWHWAKILVVGAILCPGKRTVTAALRVLGLSNEQQFQNYHRVLNRATWSSRALSRMLLRLLVRAFVPLMRRLSLVWTTTSNVGAATTWRRKAFTATPCAPVNPSSLRVVAYAGSQ